MTCRILYYNSQRNQRIRYLKWLLQVHTASQWQNQHSHPSWSNCKACTLSGTSCCPQQRDCLSKRRDFSPHVGNLGCGEGREGGAGGERERRKNHSMPVSDSKITLRLSAPSLWSFIKEQKSWKSEVTDLKLTCPTPHQYCDSPQVPVQRPSAPT